MVREVHISRVTTFAVYNELFAVGQRGRSKATAWAWMGEVRLGRGPSAGRALVERDVGFIKRIENNMAGWLHVRYFATTRICWIQQTLLRCIVMGTSHNHAFLFGERRFDLKGFKRLARA